MNPYEGKICPACNQPITENDAVAVCGECNAPQHLSCWQKKQGCSTEGCVGQIKEVFEPENGEDPEQNTEVPETAEAPTDISENETTKSKKQKRMIAVAVSCSAVAVIAAGILFTVLFAIPFSKYKKASSMLEEGKYDAAYTDFRELDGFLQSEEKSNEALYRKAKEAGCNKIALGHHFDDVTETVLMSTLYSGQYQTMLPVIDSTNFEGMRLIRPLYLVRERDIIRWRDENGLCFLRCACRFTENAAEDEHLSKRAEVKKLIARLEKIDSKIPYNIFNSTHNAVLDEIMLASEESYK